ncbi:hypothetical protein H0H93_014060 [Arthromyces matolae]|nr:hypothetical protein H0H93_014060 [Arthromyces matolae]
MQEPMHAPLPTQNQRVECANPDCYNKNGTTRTLANVLCIDRKCINCCKNATAHALEHGVGRAPCNAHKQRAVQAPPPPPPPTQPPSVPTIQYEQFTRPGPRSIVPIDVQTHSTPTETHSQNIVHQQHHRHPPFRNDTATTIQPPRTNPRLASAYTQAVSLHPPSVNPRRTLAQPIHPDWAGARSVAERERVSLKTAKIKKEEMQKQEDRTALLVVWYADGKEPLRLNHYIESFPKFQLASSASLISDLYNHVVVNLFGILSLGHEHLAVFELATVCKQCLQLVLVDHASSGILY